MCLTGRTVDANEAHQLGLVSRLVAPTELMAVAREVATDIAAFPRELSLRTKAKIIARMSIDPSTKTLDL
jgi:enoyl-CoA hydratase